MGEQGTRGGREETVTGTGTGTETRTKTGTGTRAGMGARTGAETETKMDRRMEGGESLGTYEVVVEVLEVLSRNRRERERD